MKRKAQVLPALRVTFIVVLTTIVNGDTKSVEQGAAVWFGGVGTGAMIWALIKRPLRKPYKALLSFGLISLILSLLLAYAVRYNPGLSELLHSRTVLQQAQVPDPLGWCLMRQRDQRILDARASPDILLNPSKVMR